MNEQEAKQLVEEIAERADVRVRFENPGFSSDENVLQMDVVNRDHAQRQAIRLWPGNANVKILNADKRLKQALISVREDVYGTTVFVPTGDLTEAQARKKYGDRFVWYGLKDIEIKKDVDRRERRFLLGKDESYYFISQVRGRPKTVAEAHEKLLPQHLRGRDDVVRQGEWLLVPASNEELARITREWPSPEEDMDLSHAYNEAHLSGYNRLDLVESGHRGELVIETSDNRFYVRGSVTHDRHKTLHFKEWTRVEHNTEVPESDGLGFFD